MDILTILYKYFSFKRGFEYGESGIFKLLRLLQKLHQSTWDHERLYAERSSVDEQLLRRLPLRKPENTNMVGS
jgi:hypothetical protein